MCIRDSSYARGRAEFVVEDLGFLSQRRLWEDLGRPPVIDSSDILRAPDVMLERLCEAIDIAWDPAMLSWEAGLRPEDGAWAPYWYHSVHSSTGFGAPPQSLPILDKAYQPVHSSTGFGAPPQSLPILDKAYQPYLEAVQPEFDILYENRLKL